MKVTVNHIDHEVPFDLSIITLGQFIAYNEQYGKDLDQQLIELQKKEYKGDEDEIALDRAIDIENHLDHEALAWFSFWTKHDLFEVKNKPFIQPLLDGYRIMRHLISEGVEKVHTFPLETEWNGEQWEIQDFRVNPSSQMSFNEIITSKEATRQVYKIGKGKWDGLPYLCSVFFRKKGEPFTDELILEEGERLELLNDLPLKYAFQVAFFLTASVIIWRRILVSLGREEEITMPSS